MLHHGGDRYRNHIQYDFSININPLGMPESVRQAMLSAASDAQFYPDPEAEELTKALCSKLENNWKVPITKRQMVLGNGASELIQAVVHAVKPAEIVLPVPSFAGYRWASCCESSILRPVPLKEEEGFLLSSEAAECLAEEVKRGSLLILTNPNNPTGRYIPSPSLDILLRTCKEKDAILLLDECFMELSTNPRENCRIPELIHYPNLLILRAFTKSFAIPGVRLGYLLGSGEVLLNQIRRQLPEWNLSCFAQAAGSASLECTQYLENARQMIEREKAELTKGLQSAGYVVYDTDTNFILFRVTENRASSLYRDLLKEGILIRDCSDYPGLEEGYYRIAVRTHEENKILIRKILQITLGAV